MFDNSIFPKALDEDLFLTWLENGRLSKIRYHYLLIIWNELDQNYWPVYAESREKIDDYEQYGSSYSSESLIAAYDLYSESRIDLNL